MRVVTWNIHSARGLDGITSVQRIAETIAALEPDVVGLNEVRATPGANQARLLSELLGMPAAFQRNLVRPGFRFGNAILTRGHLIEYRNVPLPSVGEPRGLLLARVEVDGERLLFGSMHLGLLRAERSGQLAAIAKVLPAEEPVVIAGDFNERPGRLALLGDAWELAMPLPTFPARAPVAAIDLVVHSERVHVEGVEVVATLASDHRPVVADISIS